MLETLFSLGTINEITLLIFLDVFHQKKKLERAEITLDNCCSSAANYRCHYSERGHNIDGLSETGRAK